MTAVELHRCRFVWAKASRHPCWRVQSALDEAGIRYRIVKEPVRRGRRTAVIEGTGQSQLPAIRREDGSWYRKESAEMAAEIRDGRVSFAGAAPVEAPGGDGSAADAPRQ